MHPLISIIIPTYNRAHLIGETIISIQQQTFVDWECIIVDDESTDDTERVVFNYIKDDERIKFFKKPKHLPKGPSAARNYGFTKSNGAYINWFDSDDLMHLNKLEKDIEHITSGNFDFTISQSAFFKVQGQPKKKFWNKRIWSSDPINDFITKNIGWSTNSPLWSKKSLVSNNLVFDEQLMTADDFKYHVQAMQYGLKPIIIHEILVKSRAHDKRLNDYKDKASNKLRTYLYLLEFKTELGLNSNTLDYLNWHFIKFYMSILRAKKIKLATYILWRCYKLNFYSSTKTKILSLWFRGLLYYIFGIGYKFFKH